MPPAPSLLRPRDAPAPVTQIELFFDLVFAFAVTQLSATLRTHLTAPGLLRTGMLFAAVWWIWVYTTWITNWLDPNRRAVRLMLIALSFLGLVLAASLPAAFARRGLPFAAALIAMQLGRSLFMLAAVRPHDPANYRNFLRITVWLAASSILWLAGALQPPTPRTALWLAALALDLASPAAGFYVPGLGRSTTADWRIDAPHLAERCAGFLLLALGESITVTGGTFFALHWRPANEAAFAAAFTGIVALWWIYFDDAAQRTAENFAKSADPGRIARAAYTYLHAVLIAGIIAVAAGDFLVLDRPANPAAVSAALMIIGGPALFLLGNGIFRRLLHPRFPPSHVCGLALLAALAAASPFMPLLATGAAASLALVATAGIGRALASMNARK
jgi:low temperature requirement protein LtrA